MKIVCVIPARYGSTRFPGKPLVEIKGKPLLRRVWELAKAAQGIFEIIIATDDERIQKAAKGWGATVMMTSKSCDNGSERVHEVMQKNEGDAFLNLQGDAVLTPPWILEAVAAKLKHYPVVTPCVPLSWDDYQQWKQQKAQGKTSGTLVIKDQSNQALYFSKGLLPFVRTHADLKAPPVAQHIGLYGYTREALTHYFKLSSTPLEKVEGLEQLRFLEHGIPLQLVEVDYKGRSAWSVDHPDDVAKVEAIIEKEGELVCS